HLSNVSLFDKVQEDSFERGLADMLANFASGSLDDDLSFAENDQVGADYFHDLENMRAIEDRFPARTQGLDEVFDDEDGSNIEAGEGFIENEDVGIVHQRGDEQDALSHALGIRAQGDVAVRREGKELQKRADGFAFTRFRHRA